MNLAALLLGRQPDPVYVPHGPITEAIAAELIAAGIWTCRTPTKPASDRPGEWTWRGRTAQCQCCQGTYPVRGGRIVAHEPAEPTEKRCDCGEFYNDEKEPVYMGKIGRPICEGCAMGDPTGYTDEGDPVHAGPDVGTNPYD